MVLGKNGKPQPNLHGYGYEAANGRYTTAAGGCSFSPDTPVLLADRTTKPIAAVQPGDTVTATDPATAATADKLVTATHINHDTQLTDLTITDTAGTQLPTIHTTPNHPFWDATTHTWTDAGHLQTGHHLLGTHATGATITAVRTFTGARDMYNLTIADTHTYYVVAGDTPVLVHNDGGDSTVGTIFRSGQYTFQIYSDDHGPPHGHLKGDGYDIQLGQNGKPLDPNVTLTRGQQKIVDDNLGTIRFSIGDRMAAYRVNGC